MRIDGIVWQKTKIKSFNGFLSDEGDILIFTKYRDGYEEHGKVLYTKQELKANRMFDKIIGKVKPEEELLRVDKKDLVDLSIMKMDPVTIAGKTYYSAYATFKVNGEEYSFTHNPGTAEETDQLGAILAPA